MNVNDYIGSDPKIMFGKPVLKGTRIPVELLLEKLAMGETIEQILLSYPKLKKESILACLLYATLVLKNEIISSAA